MELQKQISVKDNKCIPYFEAIPKTWITVRVYYNGKNWRLLIKLFKVVKIDIGINELINYFK